jgi:SAM-dependent methyltransferase
MKRIRDQRGYVAIIAPAGSAVVRHCEEALEASIRLEVVAPSPAAAFSRTYRRASLALVADPAAMPGAAAVQRLTRIPWVAVLRHGKVPALARQARAVLASEPIPGLRTVSPEDTLRLRALITDLALAPDSREPAGWISAALPAAWTFLNDRATRLAIRLTPLTGKAPAPIHPKHLLCAPWHYWYVGELRAGDRVLDIGCGNGVHSLAAARVARSVLGFDVDERQLGFARARATDEGLGNVEFRAGDLTDPEFLAGVGEFDVVLALDVIEHLTDRRAVLTRLRAVLAQGGRLIITLPNRDTPYKRWRRRAGAFAYADPDHKVEYDESGAREELERAAFRITSFERGGYDTPFAGFTALVGAVSLRAYARIATGRYRRLARRPERAAGFRIVAEPASTDS